MYILGPGNLCPWETIYYFCNLAEIGYLELYDYGPIFLTILQVNGMVTYFQNSIAFTFPISSSLLIRIRFHSFIHTYTIEKLAPFFPFFHAQLSESQYNVHFLHYVIHTYKYISVVFFFDIIYTTKSLNTMSSISLMLNYITFRH